ncbi:hypothetical protein F4779DRAFT_339023 [Xylariaceae sp. FL0662B]|nr:hypothetical protein F4779DRAFT_339023 [Xylariaceae sp. FL0662B]
MAPFLNISIILSIAAPALALGTGWPNSGTQSGEIHIYSWNEAKEVGCLTADGKWTASGACDTFTAQALGPVTVDRNWIELDIKSSQGNKCWFPDTVELVCDSSVDQTLWLHAEDYNADILVHSRALDSYLPLNGKPPSGSEAVPLKGAGQIQDGNRYQLIWVEG